MIDMTDKIEWHPNGTPGPFTLTHNSWEVSTIYDSNSDTVAEVRINPWVDEETQDKYERIKECNARAIAEVPAMVQALRAIVWMQPRTFAQDHWFQKAVAILARIDGGNNEQD